MAKTSKKELLDDIADDFHTYLRKGVRFDQVVGSAHPDLNIDNIEKLLRIHFVLTDSEEDDTSVGVLDFMRQLEERIRRMKTTTSPKSFEHHGEIRGQIDWQETVKTRARSGRLNEPIFVCDQPEEHYNINENLVLKRLLEIIHDILNEDLEYALGNPEKYEWLDTWTNPETDAGGENPEPAAEMLNRIYERNIYLQRIEVSESDITNRTIESVKKSRSVFYQEAAILLDKYRQLMNQELDSTEARDILNNTIIAPEKTDVLFELYWIFRILDAYEGIEYQVLTNQRESPSVIAEWEQGESQFVLSHDSTGELLAFNESINSDDIEPDGYLYRMSRVLSRWESFSEDLLNHSGSDTLWGGRPDIVLEKYKRDKSGEKELEEVFLGEVKYTQDTGYVATGLRELMEYMAFARNSKDSNNEYFEKPEDLLDSVKVKGLLLVDELDRDTVSPAEEEIEVVQYPESLKQVL